MAISDNSKRKKYWQDLDSGVEYEQIHEDDRSVIILTDILQCVKTRTTSGEDDITERVLQGEWAPKFDLPEEEVQRLLTILFDSGVNRNVHWLTFSRQEGKVFLKVEVNNCQSQKSNEWDLVRRIKAKYPNCNKRNFVKHKLNIYIDVTESTQYENHKRKITDAGIESFREQVKREIANILRGKGVSISLIEFNNVLYGVDYIERLVYAWLKAKDKAEKVFAAPEMNVLRPGLRPKLISGDSTSVTIRSNEKALQMIIAVLAGVIVAFNYGLPGRADWNPDEVKNFFELWFLLSITLLVGVQSLLREDWNVIDALRGVRRVTSSGRLSKFYRNESDFLIDLHRKGLTSVVLADDKACALKLPNGRGWYKLKTIPSESTLREAGVKMWQCYNEKIAVTVEGKNYYTREIGGKVYHVTNEPAVDVGVKLPPGERKFGLLLLDK